jgi:hypothetical protein
MLDLCVWKEEKCNKVDAITKLEIVFTQMLTPEVLGVQIGGGNC